ncbi:hypothetical protein APS56_06605 [Pseudalgibacter alginicilyticus]|uniref:Lipoprotein n=1 Tax=Pseudalgibacter alginicilyticus TaxID=1736674 RepID=A0A0P0D1R2_9FLAO|nr:hypothetical protein [Pseudalgibacter alginicilyticus]ALJ04810.1 hypothetical protein APS56_06605 [Pseudalgibacter alginicilyticus]
MKKLTLILILILSAGCSSKTKTEKAITEQVSELKPPFKNQGGQEDFWAQEFFKDEYEKQNHIKFNGEIKIVNEYKSLDEHGNFITNANEISFGNRVVEINLNDNKLRSIFENGILYPDLISEKYFKIWDLEELSFLNKSPKIKKFRIFANMPERIYTQIILLELKNESADNQTSMSEFIENAQLTFIKEAWLMM